MLIIIVEAMKITCPRLVYLQNIEYIKVENTPVL